MVGNARNRDAEKAGPKENNGMRAWIEGRLTMRWNVTVCDVAWTSLDLGHQILDLFPLG